MNQSALDISERRGNPLPNSELWEQATAEQKLALYDLHRFGYRLLFMRHSVKGPIAVVCQQNDIALIYHDGEIDIHPKISIRQQH